MKYQKKPIIVDAVEFLGDIPYIKKIFPGIRLDNDFYLKGDYFQKK